MSKTRVLITGGSGDLGTVVSSLLLKDGFSVTSLDPLEPTTQGIDSIQGSILDRTLLDVLVANFDIVIHIAAWHGFHAFTKTKTDAEFWDLNMTGTFNLLNACEKAGVKKLLFISSSSVEEWPDIYGTTKLLGEELCRSYSIRASMQILALRPRAFIPWWNMSVYKNITEWAAWFTRGAIHIDDVAQSCLLGCHFLRAKSDSFFEALILDGKRDLSDEDLADWKNKGGKAVLANHFPHYRELIMNCSFIPTEPPTYRDNSQATELLGFRPRYGLGEMLEDVAMHDSRRAA